MTQLQYIIRNKSWELINFAMQSSQANLLDDDLYLYLYPKIHHLEGVTDTKLIAKQLNNLTLLI